MICNKTNLKMASRKVYLIRHGQTDYNKSGIMQGCKVNASLNDTGKEQSKAFFEHYKDVPFDKIYTSSLNRSIESVKQFIDQGIEWEQSERLNEISWGEFDGEKVAGDPRYRAVVDAWHEGDFTAKAHGGESPVDVMERQKPVWDRILEEPVANTLICMHGRAMRILLCYILGENMEMMKTFEHDNLGLYLLEITDGKTKLIKANDTTHL